MRTEKRIINEIVGRGNPYRVPDGYFDNIASDIINKLPLDEKKSIPHVAVSRIHLRLVRKVAVAACLVGVMFTAGLLFHNTILNTKNGGNSNTAEYSNSASNAYVYMNQVFEYSMKDNNDIYAYVSGH